MDPNATLAMIRDYIAEGDTEAATDLFGALDEWIVRGGFLPDHWACIG